jgi:hypothetical protein
MFKRALANNTTIFGLLNMLRILLCEEILPYKELYGVSWLSR